MRYWAGHPTQGGAAPRIADLWLGLRLVVTWTCAGAGIAMASLRRAPPPRTRILELGCLSSEFHGTITLGKRAGSGLPTLDTHFFEFVERDRWDRGEPELLTLDRIRKGVDYYQIVTTPSGLYRYFINDLVRVKGFLHETPEAARFGAAVDAKLRELNVEYRAKRESERLGPPSAAWLAAETGEAYKRFCVKQGQREGQFKTVALACRKGFGFDLETFAEGNR